MKIPSSHPRARSLKIREKLVCGLQMGITSRAGLIAHGRGEALDYLLGERIHDFARNAIGAAAAYLLLAKHPVISVNGNVAALVGKELATLSNRWAIPLEVNIFHHTKAREQKIIRYLIKCGAKKVFGSDRRGSRTLQGLNHPRRKMNPEGIAKADVVFVPLEDGDRCLALRKAGKKVITVDLNPLSRTARSANVAIIDELTRVIPMLDPTMRTLWKRPRSRLLKLCATYDNRQILEEAESHLRRGGVR